MPSYRISQLAETSRPLLNKFYRQHRSSMRASTDGQLWVLRDGEILAGMSLSPVAQGYWLTGLFVAPPHRGQGLAGRLLDGALGSLQGPVWLFCHPDLAPWYQRLGFVAAPRLPQPLAERLVRYQRSKPLLAMARP
ncbi:GNAT family N-acetyltransferase [Pseudomonas sp. KCJK8993]|uniref:GNAT family N-acetyltransferase n=1 Tax=Pseudomonas sp. KCJK8993 TaxID=3344565 RepID=UPI003905BD0F